MTPAPRTEIPRLDPAKFRDPRVTAKGEIRARVSLTQLDTLWFNTGTLCNLTCKNCYIESSPLNDSLVYLSAADVLAYLDEIAEQGLATTEIGFTGGEPFMNPEFPALLRAALDRGFKVLVLTNAMRPMMKQAAALAALIKAHGPRLTIRVSLDHFGPAIHEAERGAQSWQPSINGLLWLKEQGAQIAVASRNLSGQPDSEMRQGFARLFADLGLALDAQNPAQLVIFPEMDLSRDVPEITEACWGILQKSPADVMCASSRMIVKRRGATAPVVVACTLLPHEPAFELGGRLADADTSVALNHPHCARFCVLGGASCSAR